MLNGLLTKYPDLRDLLEQSLTQAALANPHVETNPVRTVEQWCAYVERFARSMPWQTMDIGEDASFFRRIDQNIGYFYFLLDQPLNVLHNKGYIYPSLQYEPRVAQWLKEYNTAWGEWLSSPDSWNDNYYQLALSDPRFELNTNRYESPDNWHSWNDFFTRKLRNPVHSFTHSLIHSLFPTSLRRKREKHSTLFAPNSPNSVTHRMSLAISALSPHPILYPSAF